MLEQKEFDIRVLEIKQEGDVGKAVILLSPYGNVDLGNDRVMPSIGKKNNGRKVPLLKQHTVGTEHGHLELFSDKEALKANLELYLAKTDGVPIFPEAWMHYELLKQAEQGNVPVKYSIGYVKAENGYKFVKENGRTVRELTDIEIKEGSRVTFPMNENAQYVPNSVKAVTGSVTLPLADEKLKWNGSKAEKNVLDFYRDEEDVIDPKAQDGFFWVDTTNPNVRKSYKLGFADIIDGKLVAVPRGIIAVAGVLQGAMGGVDISDADIEKIKEKVAKYYVKMNMIPPWEKEEKGEVKELEEKALNFTEIIQLQNANEMRWKLIDGLNSSLRSLMEDAAMTEEEKIAQLEQNVADFSAMYIENMTMVIKASNKNTAAKKSIIDNFERKTEKVDENQEKKDNNGQEGEKKALEEILKTLKEV